MAKDIGFSLSLTMFHSYICIEVEYPLHNLVRDKFSSLFEDVILGSLKTFFQLDQQVDISLYLMEATTLRHSRELASLKPS